MSIIFKQLLKLILFNFILSISLKIILFTIYFYNYRKYNVIILIFLSLYNNVPQTDKDGKNKKINNANISDRTEKQIDNLPTHAQEIFKEAHKNALDQYSDPKKRRGGKMKVKKKLHIKLHGLQSKGHTKKREING